MRKPSHIGKPRDPPALRNDIYDRAVEQLLRLSEEAEETPKRQRPGRKPQGHKVTEVGAKS